MTEKELTQAQEALNDERLYLTPVMFKWLLDVLVSNGFTTLEISFVELAEDSNLKLTGCTYMHEMPVIKIGNMLIIAGLLYHKLKPQPRWLWNVPFFGELSRLRKELRLLNRT